MSQQTPARTVSQESTDGIRKRVCKACDRCRLKKSKCDGAHPCSRCKADNAICVFGERKKSHDKVYPKGYVEMLEQQQSQLVSGLQELYKRLSDADAWSSGALSEAANGHPLTHDILAALDLLEPKQNGSGDMESFEEDCQKLQNRLLSEGAGYVQRRGSFSSDSEHSQREPHSRNVSQSTPTMVQTPIFRDSFSFGGSPMTSPTLQSPTTQLKPVLRQVQSFAAPPSTPMHLQQQQQQHHHHHHGMTPIHHHGPAHGHVHGGLSNDPQLYQPDWTLPDMSTPEQVMRAKFALQSGQMLPHHQQHPHHMPTPSHLGPHQRPPMSASHHAALSQQQQQQQQQPQPPPGMFESSQFDTPMPTAFVDAFHPDLHLNTFAPGLLQNGTVDFSMDPMEMDFNKFISVTT